MFRKMDDFFKSYATFVEGTLKMFRVLDADSLCRNVAEGHRTLHRLTLQILIHHEIHHRGQMTVLMRQAGLKVPGIYGPSKEVWAQYGMELPPY